MPKPKDLAAEKSADTKKQSQTPTQSRTSSTTTSSPPATTSARSDALLITKKEEVEKACFKLCRAGINLMKLYRNENTTIQKEIEASQKQALTELQELVKDLRECQHATSTVPNFEQVVNNIRDNVEKVNGVLFTHFLDWTTDVSDRIDRLLKMKTPCALTKVDLINTVRQEYDRFRDAQRVRDEQRPTPCTPQDLKVLHDNYEELRKRIDTLEGQIQQYAKDNASFFEKTERTLTTIEQYIRQDAYSTSSSSASSRCSRSPTPKQPETDTKRKMSPTLSTTSSKRARTQRSSRDPPLPGGEASSLRGTPSQTEGRRGISSSHRRTPSRPEIRQRALTPSRNMRSDELRRELTKVEGQLREINAQMEHELRINSARSQQRHQDLRREKEHFLDRRSRLRARQDDLQILARRQDRRARSRENRGSTRDRSRHSSRPRGV
ncbi:hypothetical protein GCK32_014924 [Trichostrongylus colubriformis]|uniref:Uncharacterized protein n=1 Tax=Trichostrongylus colubriformis TaxID=6319 RepID=A0AAN8J2R8_TRICO